MRGYHRHNDIELNLVTAGRLIYEIGGKSVIVEAGQLAAFWAALPHRLVSSDGVIDMHWLTLPLAHFLHWQLPVPIVRAILDGRVLRSSVPAGASADVLRMQQWALDLHGQQPDVRTAVLLEIEARLRRIIIDGQRPSRTTRPDAHDSAARMSNHIAAHYITLRSVDEVAAAVGLRPTSAMTVFKRAFGITLLDHITHYRVAHAQQLLITTDRKVLGIALDSGFGSLSRFNVAFRAVCGMTPRAYRGLCNVG